MVHGALFNDEHLNVLKRLLILYLIVGWCGVSIAQSDRFSLELQGANLPDAIRLLAQSLAVNVIISPTVTGVATLHFQQISPEEAFATLLSSYQLAAWKRGNILFVAPRDELIKMREDELKWRTILTETAPLVVWTYQIKYARAADIAHLLQDNNNHFLSSRASLSVDERTNILSVEDIRGRLNTIQELVKHWDIPIKQIVIEARLVSIDQDMERQLGIHFGIQSTTNDKTTGIASSFSEVGQYSIAVAKLADGSMLDVKLSALENAGHAELISKPKLFTANQQSASIEAGEEVPYQEVSEGGGTAVVFKKAVLGLKVTPQILPGNQVLLQLQINQDRPSSHIVLGMPTISTRQIMTNALVKNGNTIVLGGIYERSNEMEQQRLPFLSQLPLVGWFFKDQSKHLSKRELLIFVTPKIMT